jgi:predicted RNA binding protein YcfA (HicA-like mRNA interferase family)
VLGKPRRFSGRELCTILKSCGFLEVRQRGSHIIMQKQVGESTITVPVPDHKEIRIGTLKSIIRQSKIPHGHFEE